MTPKEVRAANLAKRKGETAALLAAKRLQKVHPYAEVQMRTGAFFEKPWVPDKVEALMSWPWARFFAGYIAGGVAFMVMGTGETADDAVEAALKKYPKPLPAVVRI